MLDFIKISARVKEEEKERLLEMLNPVGLYDERTGDVLPFLKTRNHKYLTVTIKGKKESYLEVSGSIQKFYRGNNHEPFTASDLVKAIAALEKEFGIPADRYEVKSFEASVTVEHPPVHRHFLGFDKYRSLPMVAPKSSMTYGAKADTGEKSTGSMGLKIYDKTFDVNRTRRNDKLEEPLQHLEVVVRSRHWYNRRFKENQIGTLNSFKKTQTHQDLATLLVEYVQKAQFSGAVVDYEALQERLGVSQHALTTAVALRDKGYSDFMRDRKPETFKKSKLVADRIQAEMEALNTSLAASFKKQAIDTVGHMLTS